MNKTIALWVHPRSLSTAVERMMMERGDFDVLHEPFSLVYYYIEKRAYGAHMHPDSKAPKSWEEAVAFVVSRAKKRPVFFKDMSYHVIHHADENFLKNFTNTFLIRDPEPTLLSHYRMNPDFTFEESGYETTYKLFEMAQKVEGKTPVVIDATDLENDPERIVKDYCESCSIPYIPEALHWKPGEIKAWSVWKEWHIDAMESNGFVKQMEKFNFTLDIAPKLREFYQKSLPFYEKMYEKRIGSIKSL